MRSVAWSVPVSNTDTSSTSGPISTSSTSSTPACSKYRSCNATRRCSMCTRKKYCAFSAGDKCPGGASNCCPVTPESFPTSRAAISAYRGPLLSSHGDRDGLIPYALGRALFDAATNATEPRRFVSLPGLDHNDTHPDSYYAELDAFIAALPIAVR